MHRFRWDGRTSAGVIAADGEYHIRVGLRHQGRTVTSPRKLFLDTTPPRPVVRYVSPDVITPGAGGRRSRASLRFTGRRDGPRCSSTAPTSESPAGRTPGGTDGQSHASMGRQDRPGRPGRPAPSGSYLLAVQVRDVAGNIGPVKLPPRATRSRDILESRCATSRLPHRPRPRRAGASPASACLPPAVATGGGSPAGLVQEPAEGLVRSRPLCRSGCRGRFRPRAARAPRRGASVHGSVCGQAAQAPPRGWSCCRRSPGRRSTPSSRTATAFRTFCHSTRRSASGAPRTGRPAEGLRARPRRCSHISTFPAPLRPPDRRDVPACRRAASPPLPGRVFRRARAVCAHDAHPPPAVLCGDGGGVAWTGTGASRGRWGSRACSSRAAGRPVPPRRSESASGSREALARSRCSETGSASSGA